jgi:hypothetical protein
MRTAPRTKCSLIAIHTTLVLALTLLPLRAQEDKTKAADSSEVHRLFIEDQADRPNSKGLGMDWSRINERDRKRRERTHQLLAAGELKSAQDFHDAAYIFQHGDSPDDFLLAHVLATVAVAKGDGSSLYGGGLWIAAASLDRYLQSIKTCSEQQGSQVFGTQYGQVDSKPWTQGPYDRNLMPDALRVLFGVRPLSEQEKLLDEYNKSKPANPPTNH